MQGRFAVRNRFLLRNSAYCTLGQNYVAELHGLCIDTEHFTRFVEENAQQILRIDAEDAKLS